MTSYKKTFMTFKNFINKNLFVNFTKLCIFIAILAFTVQEQFYWLHRHLESIEDLHRLLKNLQKAAVKMNQSEESSFISLSAATYSAAAVYFGIVGLIAMVVNLSIITVYIKNKKVSSVTIYLSVILSFKIEWMYELYLFWSKYFTVVNVKLNRPVQKVGITASLVTKPVRKQVLLYFYNITLNSKLFNFHQKSYNHLQP